jgi:electron-transferring-flavoprotein dehydrogenase
MASQTQSIETNTKTKTKGQITYDLVLVGGSPSNLTLASRLCDLVQEHPEMHLSVAILEKGEAFGAHIVSGAVVNKSIFDKAYPNHIADGMPIEAVCNESHFSILGSKKKFDMPSVLTRAVLPDFIKDGYYILTLSNVVAWMAEQLQKKAEKIPNITIDMFPGFPATKVIFETDENNEVRVSGVKVSNTGDPLEDNIYGSLICFGDKGFVSKDIIKQFSLESNPQLWSVGVKETWKLAPDAPDMKGKVFHTLGYPTMDGSLGGGFIYGLDHKRLTIGLVISLDSKNPNIHPQKQLQEYKKHPWLQKILKGAELLHYGAAVLPEGGLASLPKSFQVNGALLLGDALGLLDMKSLAGVDKAIESGYLAADTVISAFKNRNFSAEQLSSYQEDLEHSPYMDKLKANRYFRKAFLDNPKLLEQYIPKMLKSIDNFGTPVLGALEVGLSDPIGAVTAAFQTHMMLQAPDEVKSEVKYKPGYLNIDPDFSKELMKRGLDNDKYSKTTVYSREDAVFYAKTKYEEHPHHIDEFSAETCLKCISKYEDRGLDVPCVSDCTAEVHRLDFTEKGIKVHGMSLENCVQCRTCELICPEQNLRVNAAYSGAGPDFRGL